MMDQVGVGDKCRRTYIEDPVLDFIKLTTKTTERRTSVDHVTALTAMKILCMGRVSRDMLWARRLRTLIVGSSSLGTTESLERRLESTIWVTLPTHILYTRTIRKISFSPNLIPKKTTIHMDSAGWRVSHRKSL